MLSQDIDPQRGVRTGCFGILVLFAETYGVDQGEKVSTQNSDRWGLGTVSNVSKGKTMVQCALDDKKARAIIRLLRQGYGTDDIVAQGVCTKHEVQEVVSFLREHNLLGRIIERKIK